MLKKWGELHLRSILSKSAKASKSNIKSYLLRSKKAVFGFISANKIGTAVILLATIIFFSPIIARISSYNPGGDSMFNAWTLSRDHHCILHQGCPNYSDGNIFFPNKDSMLYSETQLSAGLLTLPLHFINPNPIFTNNVWTIMSVFFGAWFMYLLAKRLSGKNEVFSILSGLVFAFAPFKLVATDHLQNLSIFYLPLIFLIIFNILESPKKRYLFGLFAVLTLQFYASWYQMVFALVAMGSFLVVGLLIKLIPWRKFALISIITALSCIAVLPVAQEYMRFSKSRGATVGIAEQNLYSSRVVDYFTPQSGTLEGKLARSITSKITRNTYNSDSVSYHGLVLYLIGFGLMVFAIIKRRGKKFESLNKQVIVFSLVGAAGFIMSLGPVLQIKAQPLAYTDPQFGTKVVVALPYVLVDRFLPQLSFIRAIGRASVIFLFALCCLLAYLPRYLDGIKAFTERYKRIAYALIVGLVLFELMPLRTAYMSTNPYAYNLKIPEVYKYIKDQKEINDIIVLASDYVYPGNAPYVPNTPRDPVFQQVLWAGYHNKNIYNGYSGYFPKDYAKDYDDFLDFNSQDIIKLKSKNLKYVLIDNFLSSTQLNLDSKVSSLLKERVYKDDRYSLYKVQ